MYEETPTEMYDRKVLLEEMETAFKSHELEGNMKTVVCGKGINPAGENPLCRSIPLCPPPEYLKSLSRKQMRGHHFKAIEWNKTAKV
jgi:hypothetical protein